MDTLPTGSDRARSPFSNALVWLVIALSVGAMLLVPAGVALGTKADANGHKVTICHRTNSTTNPYVIITVDYSGADGALVHDNGNGDHTKHLGPLFDFDNPPPPPHNEDQWGDIIPAYSWAGDKNHPGGSFPGLNWTSEGQAFYAAGCGAATTTTTTSNSSSATE